MAFPGLTFCITSWPWATSSSEWLLCSVLFFLFFFFFLFLCVCLRCGLFESVDQEGLGAVLPFLTVKWKQEYLMHYLNWSASAACIITVNQKTLSA